MSSSQPTKLETDSLASSAAGIVLSILITCIFSIALFLRMSLWANADDAMRSPLANQWKIRARSSLYLFYVGYVLLTFSILTLITGIFLPWSSLVLTNYSYSTQSAYYSYGVFQYVFEVCDLFNYCYNVRSVTPLYYIIPGIILIIGLLFFIIPAWILSGCATLRVMRVSKFGVLPSTSGCCLPSLPAIQGLGWFGFLVSAVGVIWLAVVFSVVYFVSDWSLEAGFGLSISGIIALFIANILFSVSACCVGHLPGIGRSQRNCCDVERSANIIDPQHIERTTDLSPAYGVVVDKVNSA
jgi:hypothetical protein